MRSTAEPLEGNRVKLSVEIDEPELEKAVADTFKKLASEVRVPGFRPGKVPRRLLEVRLGSQTIRDEVIRHALPDYYAQAVEEAELDTIAAPEIDIISGEKEGPLAFDAVVEVRPKVSIAGYEGLVVTVPAVEPTDEEVEARLDRLREQFAELTEVERPAATGDVVTLNIQALVGGEPSESLSADDFVYEIGTAGITEAADARLHGAKVGDMIDIDAPEVGESGGTLRILVKVVREKVLPEATDEWATDASEFETVDELRSDLRDRLARLRKLEVRLAVRERAVEALCELVTDELPVTLVQHQAGHLQSAFERQLASRGLDPDAFYAASGQDAEAMRADFENQAQLQVRRDLALRALADAEQVTIGDADLVGQIERLAGETGLSARQVATRLAEGGGLEQLRFDVRNEKTVEWLTKHVEIVDEQGEPVDRALLDDGELASTKED